MNWVDLALRTLAALCFGVGPKEDALERIVARLSLEPGVAAVSWEVVGAVDAEDASISATKELVRAT